MKKRLIAVIAAVAVMSTVFVGCGKTEDKPADKAADTKKEVKVGLVADQGGVHDGSFNQSAYKGITDAASDKNVKALKPIESKTTDQFTPNLKTMAGQADLIIGAGFMMQQAMIDVAKDVKDKKFVIIDGEVPSPNALSVTYKEHEGSFLAGVMAGKLTKTNKIGFIGGVEGPVIERFEAGFIAGIASVNPEAAKLLMPKDGKSHGQNVKYLGAFDKQELGEEGATMLYNQGVDIVFHAAGGAGLGVFKAAQKLNKFAIGVDSDQAVAEQSKAYKDVILFSMQKKVDTAVTNAIKDLQKGEFKGGKHLELGIKEDGVRIADTLHANVTKESKDLSDKARDMIKDGKLNVPGTLEKLLEFKPVEIK